MPPNIKEGPVYPELSLWHPQIDPVKQNSNIYESGFLGLWDEAPLSDVTGQRCVCVCVYVCVWEGGERKLRLLHICASLMATHGAPMQ